MFAAVDRSARIIGAVLRHHANATIQLVGETQTWPVVYGCKSPENTPFADVATVPVYTVSMNVSALAGLAEGDELVLACAGFPSGQLCQITTEVVPDAAGWATFDVVPMAVQDVGGADDV